MRYAIFTLRYEWRRYLAGILAVAFSTVLIGLQFGIMLGLVGLVSTPIDMSSAQVWVAARNTPSCDLGMPIPRAYLDRLEVLREVEHTDECIQNFAFWKYPAEGNSLVIVVGCNVREGTLGPGARLTPQERMLLSERGAVLLDEQDSRRLGIEAVGQTGEIFGRRVRVVGFLSRMGSITGPYVLCSLETARMILPPVGISAAQTTYLLATCRDPRQVPRVVEAINRYPQLTAYSARQFSTRSRLYWLITTKSGVAVGFIAVLGLCVGTLITCQSLYSATIVSIRELALLRALGAPRRRLRLFVLQQAFLVGLIGLCLGVPTTLALRIVAYRFGTPAVLPAWLQLSACGVTLSTALLAGLIALRSLRHTEPAQLLR